jgi:hypothetical protein
MATTTATSTLNSADLTTDALALSKTATLTNAGTTTGVSETTGVGRKTTTASSAVTIFAAADYTDTRAHKIYVCNTSSTATEFATLTIGAQNVGLLYAGDWALIPWDGTADFKYTPSVATSFTLEYQLFIDEA